MNFLFNSCLCLVGTEDEPANFKSRSELFDKLVDYFPASLTQPKRNLLDIIPIE